MNYFFRKLSLLEFEPQTIMLRFVSWKIAKLSPLFFFNVVVLDFRSKRRLLFSGNRLFSKLHSFVEDLSSAFAHAVGQFQQSHWRLKRSTKKFKKRGFNLYH
ncbi:hypothetical protein CEXT_418931 [Caerostris extrusa]|uniref:Uncharacterized protein n=1 Tax=Caerostris extrusa TaxID=172846 RepID=A0AAV4P9M2_CAEEX|nr:hypothetical protein CEXT_418931 [Caerostris extrusa]